MYDVIVAGTDGSPTAAKAVRHAGELARAFGAKLHLVTACHVVDPATLVSAVAASNYLVAPTEPPPASAELDAARAVLEDLAAPLRADGVDVTCWPVPGQAADAIIGLAETRAADLIVVGSRGMTGARGRLLGSVPNSVAHKARCAVLVVKTD